MNEKGFSVLEAMIAGAIGVVIAVAFTNMARVNQIQIQRMQEKLDLLEIQKNLISHTAGKNLCEKAFLDTPANYTIPTATFPPSSPILIPALYLDSAGTQNFAETSTVIQNGSRIQYGAIKLTNISGTAPTYTGLLSIEFQGTIMALQPVSSKVQLSTAIVGTDTVLTGCKVIPTSSSAALDTQATCEALGGFWTDLGSPQIPFCSFDSDIIDDF